MDPRPLLLLLAALLMGAQGEGTRPAPAPTFPSLALQTVKEVLEEVPGAECRRQVALTLEGIRNLTDWAVKMADSTAKLPSGVLGGNLRALGDLDECVSVEAVEALGSGAEPIRGKYCLASVHVDSDSAPVARLLDVATGGRRHLEFRHRQADLGDGLVVQSPGFVPELSRVEWGVCVPSACSAEDVEVALRGVAHRLLRATSLRLDVHVPPLACRTRNEPARPLRPAHYAFAIIIGIIAILAIIGTTWDHFCEDEVADKSSSCRIVMRAFSLRVGWKRLTSDREEELGCIAGIRALTSIYMVLAHELLYFPQEPVINKARLTEVTAEIFYTPIQTAFIVADTFFTLSGILYSYGKANSIIDGSFSQVNTLINRLIRLCPVYFLLVWYYATFLEYLGQGPNWDHYINYNVESCRQNWIWNIFFVNNYVNKFVVCVPPSWFLAVDMQLVALAPLAVLPLFRWRRGRQLMMALIALSVGLTAATVVMLRAPGFYRVFDPDYKIHLFLVYVHISTHTHVAPYLVGLFIGYILHKIKNKNISLSKGSLALGWTNSALTFLVISLGPFYIFQDNYKYNVLHSAAYPAVGRLFWAIGISWIIFTCNAGYGGLLNRLLNCYTLRVISRLSYIVNLTHFILMMHNGGQRRTPMWLDNFSWMQIFIADYMVALAVSVALYLLIDSPVNMMMKSFRGAAKKINGSSKCHENKNE